MRRRRRMGVILPAGPSWYHGRHEPAAAEQAEGEVIPQKCVILAAGLVMLWGWSRQVSRGCIRGKGQSEHLFRESQPVTFWLMAIFGYVFMGGIIAFLL